MGDTANLIKPKIWHHAFKNEKYQEEKPKNTFLLEKKTDLTIYPLVLS